MAGNPPGTARIEANRVRRQSSLSMRSRRRRCKRFCPRGAGTMRRRRWSR
jgi:hypothetical protein